VSVSAYKHEVIENNTIRKTNIFFIIFTSRKSILIVKRTEKLGEALRRWRAKILNYAVRLGNKNRSVVIKIRVRIF
jgi:hypothetical protein